ncbi:hypothetical protein Tco_0666648 [Tanacetum coccineum]
MNEARSFKNQAGDKGLCCHGVLRDSTAAGIFILMVRLMLILLLICNSSYNDKVKTKAYMEEIWLLWRQKDLLLRNKISYKVRRYGQDIHVNVNMEEAAITVWALRLFHDTFLLIMVSLKVMGGRRPRKNISTAAFYILILLVQKKGVSTVRQQQEEDNSRVGILLGHLGGAPLCVAGRPSCLLVSRKKHPGPEIIAHSIGMTLLLRIVTVPPLTGNFNIPCVVDGTAQIFLIPVLPIIPLCWDGDLITMKFIHAEVECSSSPIFTSRDIWPIGQMVFTVNTMSDG